MSDIGHNSTSFAEGQLKSLVERIERLEEERRELAQDIKEVYAEVGPGTGHRRSMKLARQMR